jgi:hypothetical protein
LKKIYNGKKFTFFFFKKSIYLSLGLHKGRPSYKRSLQLSKEIIPHFKTLNFLIFSTFVGHLALLDPDPIRIPNTDPDPLTRLNPDIGIRIRNPALRVLFSGGVPFSLSRSRCCAGADS